MTTEEKKHYDSLITFLKYTLGITGSSLTIIILVGIYFTYQSSTDFKQELKDNLLATKDEIKNSLSESKNEISKLYALSSKTMSDVQEQAEKAILNVRDEAVNEALKASKEKVEQAFKDKNIQNVIDEAVKTEIETRVNTIVTNNLQQMPNFILAVDKIRAGVRKSFIYVDSIANYSKESFYKSMAKKIIEEKTRDYENSIPEIQSLKEIVIYQLITFQNVPYELLDTKEIEKNIDSTEVSCRKYFIETKKDIEQNENLNMVALDFKVLRFLTKVPIKMFDFEAANKLQYIEGIPHPR